MKGMGLQLLRHYVPRSLGTLAFIELVILVMVFFIGAYSYATPPSTGSFLGPLFPEALLFAGVIGIAMMALGLYWRHTDESLGRQLVRLLLGFVIGLLGLAGLVYALPYFPVSAEIFIAVTGLGFIGVLATRGSYYVLTHQAFLKKRLLVLGAGAQAAQLSQTPFPDVTLVGYLPVSNENPSRCQGQVIGYDQPLLTLVKRHRIHGIVVALDDRRKHFPIEELIDCKMHGIKVTWLNEFMESTRKQISLSTLTPSAIIFSDGFQTSALANVSKRCFDVSVSVLLLVVALPIMLLTALAIFLDAGGSGPILYRQTRVGKDDQPFQVLKFRTMVPDAEKDGKPQWAQKNDARITRIGNLLRKLRIDELPQLINVLSGEMSFVGPRPERPEFVDQLSANIPYYRLRHNMKPGITGWAQISYPYGASEADAAEKLKYDLYYMKNYSLLFDITILVQTVHTVLWGRGAH